MSSICLVTGNDKKYQEGKTLFPNLVKMDFEVDEIQHPSTEIVCAKKLLAVAKSLRCDCIVDDAGLSVLRPDGTWTPGALVKYTSDFKYFFDKAVETVSLGYYGPEGTYVFTAVVEGFTVPGVENGSDWDTWFSVDGVLNVDRKRKGMSARILAWQGLYETVNCPKTYSFLFWNANVPALHKNVVTVKDLKAWLKEFKIPFKASLSYDQFARIVWFEESDSVNSFDLPDDDKWLCE